jgi:hypothetical protein
MSATTATPLTGSLLESTVDLLWWQWRAIGGAAAGGSVKKQVDLEVLCIASLVLEEHEPRLWTTLTDWVFLGSSLVSVQRLKNLAPSFPKGAEKIERLARFAVDDAKDARWSSLLSSDKKSRARSRVAVKQRSAGPALLTGPALAVRMRAAFGVGVKADLIAFLLGQHYRVTVNASAAALGYATPSVFRALQDLQAAGLVRVADLPTAAEYAMDAVNWHQVLGGMQNIAYWGYWREVITYVCAVLDWEERVKREKLSDYARGASVRELSEKHKTDLARSGALDQHVTFPESHALGEWRAFHDFLAKRFELEG